MFFVMLLGCAPEPDESKKTDEESETTEDDSGEITGTTPTDAEPYGGGQGPWGVTEEVTEVAGQEVTVYTPDAPEPVPGVIWSHGFARGPQFHVTGARRAASWGFRVATPALPEFSDHEANGVFLAEAMVPFIDSGAGVMLVGHSAGGLASLIAASLVRVDAYVGLDPVDSSGLGEDVAGSVENALVLHGEPSACNSNGNSREWVTGAGWRVTVTGASHCDFESDTEPGCAVLCGANAEERQALIQEYTVAWLLVAAGGGAVSGADAWTEGGAEAVEDRDAGSVDW